jgi:DNA-binding PadR family transcriptional regulator
MKKYRKNGNNEHYVKLDNAMTVSAAWTSLSFKAVWVYIELRKRFTYEHGFSRLVLPYSAVKWKMSPSTFSKAIQELVHYGFIRYVERGGLYRRPNVFALSDAWKTKSREIVDKEGREAILLRQKVQKTTLQRNQHLNQVTEICK